MNSRTLKEGALKVIDSYLNFSNGTVSVAIPYFNNRRGGVRAGLRAQIGKGTISDIEDEITHVALRERVDIKKADAETFKKFLVNNNIGIDCSGFAYHLLNAESLGRNKGKIRSHLSYPFAGNIIRKLISYIRSVEGAGVNTLAHNANSKIIALKDIQPGDFISMNHKNSSKQSYNHIIVVYQVDYDNNEPKKIHYAQSMAWPTDGEYRHGVRLGEILVVDLNKSITDQEWMENGKTGTENYTHARALAADQTEIRRLNWF
jgi:hypothetical protein